MLRKIMKVARKFSEKTIIICGDMRGIRGLVLICLVCMVRAGLLEGMVAREPSNVEDQVPEENTSQDTPTLGLLSGLTHCCTLHVHVMTQTISWK